MKRPSRGTPRWRLALLSVLLVAGCASARRGHADPAAGPLDDAFRDAAEAFFQSDLGADPPFAAWLGFHAYDGRLPDVSAAGLEREKSRLREAHMKLARYDPSQLGTVAWLEREAVLLEIESKRFVLEEERAPWRNPIYYDGALELDQYVAREYAPLEERARSLARAARAVPAYLAAARANLEPILPAAWLEIAIFEVEGNLDFVRDDVPTAFAGLRDAELRRDVDAALATMAAALEEHVKFLEARVPQASQGGYAMGSERLKRMIAATQGVEMDVAEVKERGRADQERNLVELAAAAKAIDAARPTSAVVQEVMAAKPADILATARSQAEELRRFLVDRRLVTLPEGYLVEVRESPPYSRNNAALLDAPGVFEPSVSTAFYYISPPDASWSPEAQRAYLPSVADLLVVTSHELWPGHLVDQLHRRENPSRILKTYWQTLVSEGWAHYGEQLVLDEGFHAGDGPFRVAQIVERLIRNVRLDCTIGLHAGGWSVNDCAQRFREVAYLDDEGAMQEAMRGTYDPMYLAYTLGKLEIIRLREEYRARRGAEFTLREFHDRFLSMGAAPLPAIRRVMLEERR